MTATSGSIGPWELDTNFIKANVGGSRYSYLAPGYLHLLSQGSGTWRQFQANPVDGYFAVKNAAFYVNGDATNLDYNSNPEVSPYVKISSTGITKSDGTYVHFASRAGFTGTVYVDGKVLGFENGIFYGYNQRGESMEKPLGLKMGEFKQQISDAITNSELPIYILQYMIRDLYNEVNELARTQSIKELEEYNQSLKDDDIMKKER